MHPYPTVGTFHAARVLGLVVFWKSFLSLKCAPTFLTAYVNWAQLDFLPFLFHLSLMLCFIIFCYLLLPIINVYILFVFVSFLV